MLDLLSIIPYYTGHLCASLRSDRDVHVTLASIDYQYDLDYFRRQGIPNDPGLLNASCRLGRTPAPVRRALKLLEYVVNVTALLIRITVSRPDVIHVQFLPLASYGLPVEQWFLRLARALGIKLVHTVHNVLPQGSGDLHKAVYKRIYHLADRLICHDDHAASRLREEFGVQAERISIIPHGPLFEKEGRSKSSSHSRGRLGLGADGCLVLWQGILRSYKGIPFLLKAWQQVCQRNTSGLLAIVGTGDRDIVQAVENEVSALGLQSRVRLELRFVSVQELDEFYDAADILAYPYSEITTSGALLTGVGRGKAVVATQLPFFKRILRHDATALLVPYGDVDCLADSLLRLIGDPDLRQSLGAHLLESQAGLPRWEEIASRTCDCYRAAVSEGWNSIRKAVGA